MTADELSTRDTLWRMTNGYQVSQAIHVVATLGIADLLKDGPRSADELARPRGRTRAPFTGSCVRWPASTWWRRGTPAWRLCRCGGASAVSPTRLLSRGRNIVCRGRRGCRRRTGRGAPRIRVRCRIMVRRASTPVLSVPSRRDRRCRGGEIRWRMAGGTGRVARRSLGSARGFPRPPAHVRRWCAILSLGLTPHPVRRPFSGGRRDDRQRRRLGQVEWPGRGQAEEGVGEFGSCRSGPRCAAERSLNDADRDSGKGWRIDDRGTWVIGHDADKRGAYGHREAVDVGRGAR